MMKVRWIIASTLVLAVLIVPAMATDLGDPAPPLKIKDWVKGDPIDLKAGKGKNVYVVEFWATWCGPCIAGMPHLTELQEKYKDKGVVIVGISDEDTDTVRPFVKKQSKRMGYVVAVDDDLATNKAYMKAFKINTIPHAFIVDKSGAIAWHGNPSGMDKALEQIVDGEYDIKAAKKVEKARKRMPKYFELVVEGGEGEQKKAAKLGKKIVKYGSSDAMLMNELAWLILTRPGIENRDLKLAMKAAKAAYVACDGDDAMIIDTYARALWDTGKKDKALKYQKKAIKRCKDKRMVKDLEKTLEQYEAELEQEGD